MTDAVGDFLKKNDGMIPVITVGKYAGTPIDQLPVSYCRWMLGQDFPKEWLDVAKRKVEASPYSSEPLTVSRHALDRYSMRFIKRWQGYIKAFHVKQTEKTPDGLATFVVKQAERAWNEGKDVSKNRHQDDGIVREFEGIKYVFSQSKIFPEYRELITVM